VKVSARIVIGLVVLMFGSILLPRPASRVVAPDAQAAQGALAQIDLPIPVPTISLPPILPKPPKPKPDPEPEPDPDPLPDPGGGGAGGGGSGGGGGGGGTDSGGGGGAAGAGPGAKDPNRRGARNAAGDVQITTPAPPPTRGTYVPAGGSYTTDNLVAVANELRALGVPLEKIVRDVYAPFIIGGKAAWTDTWGAPRYGPGPIIRTHEGQDVFCSYGDPVLATETGTVNYGDAGLGGKVARLFRSDGSYWYYAHLSDFNDEEWPSGATVQAGDVIGYCGNTGNAVSTPSHVHFGFYDTSGSARNPHSTLIKWLNQAERRAGSSITRAQDERVREIESLTLARRFGDSFMPDLSTLEDGSGALLGSTGSPSTGAFGVAQSALMAALSNNLYAGGFDPYAADLGSSDEEFDDPSDASNQLDAILEEAGAKENTRAGK
jgi:murein DD-endopeptidase MepM/ murein hydrolase activator NlpD